MSKFLKYILALLLSFPALISGGQTTSFIYYGPEQGLSQAQVQTLEQDEEGNLWVGTLAGLIRYNGKTFATFSRKDGLAEDWITASCKDKNGNLWVGHWAGGVSRYMQKTRKVENLELEKYTRFKKITSLREDENERIWITTEGAGIFVFEPVSGKVFSLSRKNGLTTNNFYAIAPDSKGNMWLASDSGIVVYDAAIKEGEENAFTVINKAKGLPSNYITALSVVNSTEMWVGTADEGAVVLEVPDKLTLKTSLSTLNKLFSLNTSNGSSSDFIETIFEDSKHNVWVGTTGGGAVKCTPFATGNRYEALSKILITVYNTRQGLNYFNVNKIIEDRESNIWIATDMGLNQYRGERFQLFNIADSIVNNLVWSVLYDSEENMWLGTNEGLSRISFRKNTGNGQVTHVIKNYTFKDGLPSNVILSMHQDEGGNMWFGTGYGGACRLRKGSDKFEVFSARMGMVSNVVYSINSDNEGNVWFGTKEGATRFSPSTGVFKNYTTADGLGGNYVYRIFKDSKGNLWFGTLGGDLSVFDGKIFRKFGEKDGMQHKFILSITEDNLHNLWFGAYGGELYKYDGATFEHFPLLFNSKPETPYSLAADNDSNIWVGTNTGMDKIDTRTRSFYHYGKAEGFPGTECNPNAICKDTQGNIWLGTISGAVRFNPKEDVRNNIEPKVLLTGLKIFMKENNFPEDGKFDYDENHLTFTFVGVSLTNPLKVLYQYKLEGFDKDWTPSYTNINEVTYSNLVPGNYTLLVKACNNNGVWNSEPLRYKFFVTPPIWQRATFYIIMGVFIVFCLYGADKIRRRNLQTAKQQLEEKVKELTVKNKEMEERLSGEKTPEV